MAKRTHKFTRKYTQVVQINKKINNAAVSTAIQYLK